MMVPCYNSCTNCCVPRCCLNRDVVSEDIEDFEYTPKPAFPGIHSVCTVLYCCVWPQLVTVWCSFIWPGDHFAVFGCQATVFNIKLYPIFVPELTLHLYNVGPFKVFNEKDEEAVLRKFVSHVQELKPHVIVTYNGDKFDWPYVETRCKKYAYLSLYKDLGIKSTSQAATNSANGEYCTLLCTLLCAICVLFVAHFISSLFFHCFAQLPRTARKQCPRSSPTTSTPVAA